jgi:hypothetical protein
MPAGCASLTSCETKRGQDRIEHGGNSVECGVERRDRVGSERHHPHRRIAAARSLCPIAEPDDLARRAPVSGDANPCPHRLDQGFALYELVVELRRPRQPTELPAAPPPSHVSRELALLDWTATTAAARHALGLLARRIDRHAPVLQEGHRLDNAPFHVRPSHRARHTLPRMRLVPCALPHGRHRAAPLGALARLGWVALRVCAVLCRRRDDGAMVTKAAIATGHAPAAKVDLGALLKQQSQSRPRRQARGRLEAAETAYRDAIATRHANYAPAAMYNLGNLLAERGRLDEAEAAFRDAIATGDPAASALAERALGILSKR